MDVFLVDLAWILISDIRIRISGMLLDFGYLDAHVLIRVIKNAYARRAWHGHKLDL